MKKCLLVLEGGIGKHIAATAILKELSKKYIVGVMTPYPDIFVGIPEVRVVYNSQPKGRDFYNSFDEIFHQEPYRGNYEKGNYHLIDSYCDICRISKVKRKPYLPQQMQGQKIDGKYVVVQFTGGQSPINFNPQNPYQQNEMHFGRNSIKNAQEIVDYLVSKKLKVVQYGLPNELQLQNVIRFDIPYMQYLPIVQGAEFIVAIDSSLMHMTASTDKGGVIMWGLTNPEQLGYEQFTNLVTDIPEMIDIPIDNIKKAIDKWIA